MILDGGYLYGWHSDGSSITGDSFSAVLGGFSDGANVNIPAIADLDCDGFPDIVTMGYTGVFEGGSEEKVGAWDKDGEMLKGWPILIVPNISSYLSGILRTPNIGEINKDGFIDLISMAHKNQLIFINFKDILYSPSAALVPCWGQNRRFNRTGTVAGVGFVCGDADNSGRVNILDVAFIINYLYRNGAAPQPSEIADVDSSGRTNILDVGYIVNYLYRGGPEPHCP